MRDATGPPLESQGAVPCADGTARSEVRTSVILPAYNEAAALPIVLRALEHELGPHDEIIVVDDGSTDETALIARQFSCRVIRHTKNRGKGTAVRTGLNAARGRYIIVMDADATYPTAYLPRIVHMLGTYDLVRCPRQYNSDVMPAINRLGNALFSSILRIMHGLRGKDPLTGLFGLRREALQRIRLRAYGFDLEVEVNVKAQAYGLRQAELPIPYYRRVGEKKLRPIRDGWRILRRVILLALVFNPLLMFVLPGALLGLASVLLAAVLSSGPLVVTPYLGFSVHSFIVASLGIPLGFQMILFGLAAALFAVTLGIPPQPWLLRACHYRTRLILFVVGLIVALVGSGGVIYLSLGWLLGGHGAFTQTELLVLSAVGVLWGMEMIGGALFLSVFSPVLDQDHAFVESIEIPS